jgi:hypothetical protein
MLNRKEMAKMIKTGQVKMNSPDHLYLWGYCREMEGKFDLARDGGSSNMWKSDVHKAHYSLGHKDARGDKSSQNES